MALKIPGPRLSVRAPGPFGRAVGDLGEDVLRKRRLAGREELLFLEPDMGLEPLAEGSRGGAVPSAGGQHRFTQKRVIGFEALRESRGPCAAEGGQEHLVFDAEVRVELGIEPFAEGDTVLETPGEGVSGERSREHEGLVVLRRQAL